jgi:hypothetical protein
MREWVGLECIKSRRKFVEQKACLDEAQEGEAPHPAPRAETPSPYSLSQNSQPSRPQQDARIEKALRDYDEGKALDDLDKPLPPDPFLKPGATKRQVLEDLELLRRINRFSEPFWRGDGWKPCQE